MSPRSLAALLFLAGCNPDAGLTKFNNVPEATITSHADGDEVEEGYVVSFRGTVSDTNDGPDELVATWFVGADELCAEAPVSSTGETTCDAVLGVGDDEVVLEGRDPENATGTARVSLVVNATDAPVAEILAPTTTGRYYAGLAIAVEASVSDSEDDADALTVVWTDETGAELDIDSTPDGGLLSGELTLDEGDHALILTVTDLTGKTGTTEIDFTVSPASTAPSCAITSPLDGGNAELGATVLLGATVSDADVPATELVATWSSDLDGALGGAATDADGTTSYLVDTLSFGTHVLTLTVADDTGLTCTDDVLFSIGTPPDVTIDAPTAGDLYNEGDVVSFLGTVSDSGTAPEGLVLTWESDLDGLLDGTPADASGLAAFDADWLSPGDHVVTLTATDAEGLYASADVAFTINGLPTAPALSITPGSPVTTDALVAAITADSVDPEGDALSYAWAWTRDGVATAYATDTLPADATTRGEVWEVVVTPNDGWGDGTPGTASVTIGNSAPVLASATLTPDPAWEGDTLSCTPDTATDADGDSVSYSYAWTIDGLAIASTDAALGDTWWSAGDVVACIVTPTDGTTAGAPVTSNSVTIDNSTPTIASVTISPSSAAAGDTLTCTASGFADEDGDSDATTYAWTVNGAAAGSGTTLAGAFAGGDTVVCTATPFDGTASGTPLSDSIVIANTPPVLASVALTPASPTVADTLTCTPGATTDADGTTSFTYAYAWTIGGGAISATSSTLTAADFERGDIVRCRVTPNDGTDDGAAMTSSAVTILNIAPTITSVTLSPSAPDTDDTLTASATGADADGDTVSFTYAWYVNGTVVAATGSTLSGTYFDRDDEVYVVATPTDGADSGSWMVSAAVTVVNSAPSLASATITPDPATVSSTLTCTGAGYADADGDADATTFAWTVNGVAAGTGPTLASGFGSGDVVACTATPDDGTDTGTARTDSITIANTAPVLASVSLTPASPTEASTLTCTPAVATDADGDTVTYAYAWYVNSSAIAPTASTLSGTYFDRDDSVYCRVTPNDGTVSGTAVSSSAVTVGNTAPILASVTLSSYAPSTSATLTASVSSSDADGDSVSYTYAWYVNGSAVAATGSTLSGATYFSRGDTVYVRVTPTDGTDAGTAMSSSTATVANTAPTLTSAAITPDPATVSSTLTCTASGFSDADGDADATTFAWTVNGAAAGTGATLSSGFGSGDVVVCTATPDDGTDTGTARTDSITIANTAPVLASVSLTPTSATESSTLTCTPAAATDADGDTVTYTYAWYVNGTANARTSTTLTGTYFDGGDTVYCRVTPNDGTVSGTATSSNTVTIGNTAPVLATVTLSSYTPTTNTTLTATATSSDADGDTVTYTYAWYVNGSVVAATGSTLSGATYFSRGDTVYVRVTPTDGTDTGTAMSSSTATVANTAPSITSVAISPTTAYAGDTLTCNVTGYSDADGDASASTYRWTVDGTAAGTSSTLSSGFVRGSVVVCTVTPNDGTTAGTAVASSSVTIANTVPVLASVALTPTTASESSTLTCTAGTTTDADGTTSFSYTYAWYVNGSAISATSTTLTGTSFNSGNTVYCRVTPSDGIGAGTAVASNTVTIGNSAPVISAVSLNSYTPATSDTLTATVTSSDADGDSVSYTYAWYVNGSAVAATGSTLSGTTYFSRGDTVYVRVTPTDGTTSGTAVSSSTATVANTVPVLSAVSLTPTTAYEASTLTCAPTATDADSDAITYTYAWYVNSSLIAPTSSTLTGTYFSSGNTVYCRVTPSDSGGSGTASSSSTVTIANTAPVLSSVTLTPTTAYEASTLTCTASATDADGTTPTYAYTWYVNSSLIAPTSSTLTGTYFARGNTVYCRVTPSDGTASGTASSSSTVTISNTAPVISSVTLSPTLVYTNDTITTSVSASDADGDSISYTYAWYVNGTAVGATSSSLSGVTYFNKGNTVYVRVTPTDGTTSGSVSTSSTVTIGNSTPAAPTVYIDPEDPEAGLDPIVCHIDTVATDADGDSITYSFTWTKNGSSYTGDTDTSTTSTVPAAATAATNVFICSVTASDGSATSSAATDTVTVLSASYTIGYSTVFASPGTGYSGTNYNLGQQITVSSAVQLYALGAGLRLADTDSIRMALYTNSGGAPGTLVAYTTLTSLSSYAAGSNVEMDVVGGPISLSAGTYWITVNTSGAVYFNYTTSGASGNTIAYNSLASTSAFPSSFGSASTYTGQILGHYMVVR